MGQRADPRHLWKLQKVVFLGSLNNTTKLMNLNSSPTLFSQTHWIKAIPFIFPSSFLSWARCNFYKPQLPTCAVRVIIPPIPALRLYFRDQKKKKCKWREHQQRLISQDPSMTLLTIYPQERKRDVQKVREKKIRYNLMSNNWTKN